MLNEGRWDEQIWKAISVGRLRQILTDFPDTHFVAINQVGNLLVLPDAGDPLGWIDLVDEQYETFAEKDT